MRKRRILFGWPRHNPRHCRFPLPNVVWEYQLKPIEFVILSYLCLCHCHSKENTLTPEIVAKGIHKSVGTVKKYLPALINAGLVTEQYSIVENFLSANEQKFFTLPNEIFLLKLPPSAFMVYAYLLLIENRRTHTCHPSYNTIASITGMAKNTVIKAIGVLLGRHLVTMEHSHYLDQRGMKWTGNNLYTILPTQTAVDEFHQQQLHSLKLGAMHNRIYRKRTAQKLGTDDYPHTVASAPPHGPKGNTEARF